MTSVVLPTPPAAGMKAKHARSPERVARGRLAVASAMQGVGLGRDLLIDAIRVAAAAGELVAARFIAVDPLNDRARSFYAAFGFRGIPDDPDGRMFIRIDEAIDALTRTD